MQLRAVYTGFIYLKYLNMIFKQATPMCILLIILLFDTQIMPTF
jgi:hypothetical protein